MLIHTDSEWIFPEIARITKCLITLEEKVGVEYRRFPRNCQEVFEALGMRQVEETNWGHLGHLGLYHGFIARIFKQDEDSCLPE